MALTKMEIYKNVINEYTFKECLTQADYVCGHLKRVGEGTFGPTKWFICPRPFRNLITQLKYPERFNKYFIKNQTQSGWIVPRSNFSEHRNESI